MPDLSIPRSMGRLEARGPPGSISSVYALVMILAMGVSLFTPPVGVGQYAACAIGRIDPDEGIGSL